MEKIKILEQKVKALYNAGNPNRADWADWLYENHVFIVSEKGKELAERFDANVEIVMAASMLHDVADAVMVREDERHEEESLNMARKLLKESDFSEEEINTIVNDAIKMHGCKNGNLPQTLEGKVMATADAVAHLTTDFYIFAVWAFGMDKTPLSEIKKWALKKFERDFNDKIFFDEIREEVREDYVRLKALFSR